MNARVNGMLYPSHEKAEEAIQTILACLPEVMTGIMVEEHQRWLDGHNPVSAAEFGALFSKHLAELFKRRGGVVKLPNAALLDADIDRILRWYADSPVTGDENEDAEEDALASELRKARAGGGGA